MEGLSAMAPSSSSSACSIRCLERWWEESPWYRRLLAVSWLSAANIHLTAAKSTLSPPLNSVASAQALTSWLLCDQDLQNGLRYLYSNSNQTACQSGFTGKILLWEMNVSILHGQELNFTNLTVECHDVLPASQTLWTLHNQFLIARNILLYKAYGKIHTNER